MESEQPSVLISELSKLSKTTETHDEVAVDDEGPSLDHFFETTRWIGCSTALAENKNREALPNKKTSRYEH